MNEFVDLLQQIDELRKVSILSVREHLISKLWQLQRLDILHICDKLIVVNFNDVSSLLLFVGLVINFPPGADCCGLLQRLELRFLPFSLHVLAKVRALSGAVFFFR